MSDFNARPSGNVLVAAVVVAFGFALAAAVVVFIAVPDGANPGSLAALIIAAFTALVPSIIGLAKIAEVAGRVERTGALVDGLANGVGDAKFEQAVHRALNQRETNPEGREATSEPGTPPDDTQESSSPATAP